MTFTQFSFSFLVVCFHLGHLVNGQDITAQWNQVINLNGNVRFSKYEDDLLAKGFSR